MMIIKTENHQTDRLKHMAARGILRFISWEKIINTGNNEEIMNTAKRRVWLRAQVNVR